MRVAAILIILLFTSGIGRAEVFKVAMPSTTQAVDHVLKRLDLRQAPQLAKIFDLTLARKVMAELQNKGWRPGA